MAEEELMFRMEEVDSLQRPSVSRIVPPGHDSSVDDEEEDFYICPITDDPISPTKGICDYLKDLVHHEQLSNSLPKNYFKYKVTPVFMAVSFRNDCLRTILGDLTHFSLNTIL